MIEKTILITGANGLLGQKLVQKLSGREAVQLIATGMGPNRNPIDDGYGYEKMDITNLAQMREVFDLYGPSEVINCAAMTNVDQCEKDREGCLKLNVTAVENLIALCKEFDAKLIHISTDFIFDGEAGPYTEKDTPNPLSYYGETKKIAEDLLISSGIPYAIARTMLVYGLVSDMSRSNIVLWAKGALEKGEKINVVNDQFRCPTLAEDLAEGVVLMTMKDREGIFNISGPDMHSIFDMVNIIAEHWELDKSLITPISSNTLNQAAKRPPKTGFIILKAQTELGYRPRTFKEGLHVLARQLTDEGR